MTSASRNLLRVIRTIAAAVAFAGGVTHSAPAQATSRPPQTASLAPAQRQAMLRAPSNGPNRESNKYMDAEYPKLDHIVKVTIRQQ